MNIAFSSADKLRARFVKHMHHSWLDITIEGVEPQRLELTIHVGDHINAYQLQRIAQIINEGAPRPSPADLLDDGIPF